MNRNSEGFDVDEVIAIAERRAQIFIWMFMMLGGFVGVSCELAIWIADGSGRAVVAILLTISYMATISIWMWGKRK